MPVTKKAKKVAVEQTPISIPPLKRELMTVTITGDTPIIFHQMAVKAIVEILARQTKDPNVTLHGKRDPQAEYYNSFYLTDEGYAAIPAINIKKAMVESVRSISGLYMTDFRGPIYVKGDKDGLIPLLYKGKPIKPDPKPKMFVDFKNLTTFLTAAEKRKDKIIGEDPKYPGVLQLRWDPVRVMRGGADVRFRPQLNEWSAKILIEFDADVLNAAQISNLLQKAGFVCGLCEDRPQKSGGDHGLFSLANS